VRVLVYGRYGEAASCWSRDQLLSCLYKRALTCIITTREKYSGRIRRARRRTRAREFDSAIFDVRLTTQADTTYGVRLTNQADTTYDVRLTTPACTTSDLCAYGDTTQIIAMRITRGKSYTTYESYHRSLQRRVTVSA